MASKPEEDEDQKAIPYSTDFRRSRRNSLFWSSLTVVACLGVSVKKEDAGQLYTLPILPNLPPPLLVALCLIVSIFMIVGFVQAQRRLKFRSSQEVFGRAANQVIEAFHQLGRDARSAAVHCQRVSDQAKARLDSLGNAFEETIEKVNALANNIDDDCSSDIPRTDYRHATEDFEKAANETEEWSARVAKKIRANHQRLKVAAEGLQEQFQVDFKVLIEVIETEEQERFQDIDKTLSKFTEKTNGFIKFSNAIRTGEKFWYYGFETFPVYILFAVAAVLASKAIFTEWSETVPLLKHTLGI